MAKLSAEEAKAKSKVKPKPKSKVKDKKEGKGSKGSKESKVEAEVEGDVPINYIPEWFDRYVEYKFNLYDRMGKHWTHICNVNNISNNWLYIVDLLHELH